MPGRVVCHNRLRASSDRRTASGARTLMPAPESKSAQPNIQDVFLNYVRRENLTVTTRMMAGSELEGRIKNFDRFALILDHSATDRMLFKHAIAAIKTP